jgi:hypothetical protein
MAALRTEVLAHPLSADVTGRPVLLTQALDAYDTSFARRVHELIAADDDADVRRTRRDRRKKHQVAWLQPIAIDALADPELIADLPRHRDAVLLVDVTHESTAVESRRVDAAIPVGRPSQRQGGPGERISVGRSGNFTRCSRCRWCRRCWGAWCRCRCRRRDRRRASLAARHGKGLRSIDDARTRTSGERRGHENDDDKTGHRTQYRLLVPDCVVLRDSWHNAHQWSKRSSSTQPTSR